MAIPEPASPALPAWLKATADGVEITLYVQPGAKKSEVAGEHDGALKLRISAPPVEGKANAAVIAFVAERCGVAKNRVALIAGEQNRHKRVAVQAVAVAFVRDQLSQ